MKKIDWKTPIQQDFDTDHKSSTVTTRSKAYKSFLRTMTARTLQSAKWTSLNGSCLLASPVFSCCGWEEWWMLKHCASAFASLSGPKHHHLLSLNGPLRHERQPDPIIFPLYEEPCTCTLESWQHSCIFQRLSCTASCSLRQSTSWPALP